MSDTTTHEGADSPMVATVTEIPKPPPEPPALLRDSAAVTVTEAMVDGAARMLYAAHTASAEAHALLCALSSALIAADAGVYSGRTSEQLDALRPLAAATYDAFKAVDAAWHAIQQTHQPVRRTMAQRVADSKAAQS